MTLLVTPRWYEFFTRSLEPLKHYWPINPDPKNLCKSIKYAVDWGNKHPEKVCPTWVRLRSDKKWFTHIGFEFDQVENKLKPILTG